MHTHYDNLKVSRTAPPEVIRAAYKVLAQRHHPDVNPSADAERVMRLLNQAYAVLSDPQQRHAHDAWIEEQLIGHKARERAAAARHARNADDFEVPSDRSQPSVMVRVYRWLGTAAGPKVGASMIAGACFVAWLWVVKPPPNLPSVISRVSAASLPAAATPQVEESRSAQSHLPLTGVLDPPSAPAASFLGEKAAPTAFSYEERASR
jgi:curved DNA-binding protein CbpA